MTLEVLLRNLIEGARIEINLKLIFETTNCRDVFFQKSWQQKYCYLFKASKFGLQRLEVWDSRDKIKNTLNKIVTLENCVKITSDSPTNFTIVTKTAPFINEFAALDVEAKAHWLSALQKVAFPDDVSQISSVEKDNDLYCSSGEGVFVVKIHPSTASERCGLDPKANYTLLLTSTAIQLMEGFNGKLLYTWPYCFIRRYGYKSGKFTFEAGRMCDSGQGTFFLEHSNQEEIYNCLATKLKSMKNLLKEDTTNSFVNLHCQDSAQFHPALNMEARSRSPLPPLPTTATLFRDVETIEKDISVNKKPKPIKPPRKILPPKNKSFYEPVHRYDEVECRNNAWKTLGLDDVSHTENTVEDENDEDYASWGRNGVVSPPKLNLMPPKVINPSSNVVEGYDELNFFGSSSKLNLNSGYKQIALTPSSNVPYTPSFNDYDEVEVQMEGIRLADDSHLGYALVRKEKSPKDDNVNHHFCNNEPYAVISKPKRV